jgi:hypothetical protein
MADRRSRPVARGVPRAAVAAAGAGT